MKFISTRGHSAPLDFTSAMLAGLAPDGGLYVPERLPQFSTAEIAAMQGLSYPQLAQKILQPFVQQTFDDATLEALIQRAYAKFLHPATAPLVQIDAQHFVLELFHGPTLAFKDFALQLLGVMMEHLLAKDDAPSIVLGATSGDTGSAAIAGLCGKKNVKIVILYPEGRPSEVQRRQMTTTDDANVRCLAVRGTFDDCQDMVKAMFADGAFRKQRRLLAVNSINIVRVLAQMVYYFYAALALGAPSRSVNFCVPTGNFGDVYAGYLAKKMGLPLGKLIIATNANDILARAVATGEYRMHAVSETLSPSMDIQIASNFERLLYDLFDRDAQALNAAMQGLRSSGAIRLSPSQHRSFLRDFTAHRIDDATTLATMQTVHAESGYVLDPHTAVGVAAVQALALEGTTVTLATAHPAKFPDAVCRACAIKPALPTGSAAIMHAAETITPFAPDVSALRTYLENL